MTPEKKKYFSSKILAILISRHDLEVQVPKSAKSF